VTQGGHRFTLGVGMDENIDARANSREVSVCQGDVYAGRVDEHRRAIVHLLAGQCLYMSDAYHR